MTNLTITFYATPTSSITDPKNERHDAQVDVHSVLSTVERLAGGGLAEWTALLQDGVGELRIVKTGRERFAQVRFS